MLKSCKRCGANFRAYHGNQSLCASCKSARLPTMRRGVTPTYGIRRCDRCWREYLALADNQRYCSSRCKSLMRVGAERRKYATPSHRIGRARWAPAVASGEVRCARGAACKRRELVDGVLVGGSSSPGSSGTSATRTASRSAGPSTSAAIRELRRASCGMKRTTSEHSRTAAGVWGSEPPAFSIGYVQPLGRATGIHRALRRRTRPGGRRRPDDPRISIVCMHCLLDDHPEIGRGLDLAREYGVADLDEPASGSVGDVSRLERRG